VHDFDMRVTIEFLAMCDIQRWTIVCVKELHDFQWCCKFGA
jgi:hypothetical protein